MNRNKVDFTKMTTKETIDLFKSVLNNKLPSFLMSKNAKYIQQIINRLSIIPKSKQLQEFEELIKTDELFTSFLLTDRFEDLLPEIDIINVKKRHKGNYSLLMAVVANPNICKFDKPIIFDCLLDRGEYIDQLTDGGQSALTIALKRKDTYVVEQLLQRECSVNTTDNYGIMPIHISTFNRKQYLTSLLGYYRTDTISLINHINLNCHHLAEIVGDTAMLSLLREIDNKYINNKEIMEL